MTNQIEIYDQKRRKYRGGHLVGAVVFFAAWIVRSVIKTLELEMETLHTIVFGVLLAAIVWMAYFAVRLIAIERAIKKQPTLKEALYNEVVRLNELKSWKIAFFSLILFHIAAAYLVIMVPIKDAMLPIVTGLLVGFGAYNLSVYILDR